jgi:hypothetical protein
MSLQRRAPMKRTPFTRMPPAAEPRHAGPGRGLARRAGLKARSAKTAKVYRDDRGPLVAGLLAAHPWCEIRWDHGCQSRAWTFTSFSPGAAEAASRRRETAGLPAVTATT